MQPETQKANLRGDSPARFFRMFRVFRGPSKPTTLRKQGTLLFCLLFFCYSYIHQRMGWNQNSRLDLLHALFVHKTFKIDAYHENTGDKSIHDGHYYSDKAPGIVFLAIPAFAASVGILNFVDVPLDSPRGWLASSWITTAGSVGWITAMGGVAMFVFLSKMVGQRDAYITTLAVFLGSLPFPYATMLFSHAAVIGLICIALWAIGDGVFWSRMIRPGADATPDVVAVAEGGSHCAMGQERPWAWRHLLAGLCCGLAISSEYTAATAAGGVLALALIAHWRRGVLLGLGAVPALLLIPIYNWVCFGGPLAFGYHHLALPEFQAMNQGLFGITFPPKASAAYLILLSPERGLFFWSPFFLMAFFGTKHPWRLSRPLWLVAWSVVIVHVICISGYYMPGGGAALGPRHLAPMLPFAVLAATSGLSRWPRVGCYCGYLAIVFTGLGTFVEAMPPDGLANPAMNLHLPRFCDGLVAQNLGYLLGLPQFVSILWLVGFLIVLYGKLVGSSGGRVVNAAAVTG